MVDCREHFRCTDVHACVLARLDMDKQALDASVDRLLRDESLQKLSRYNRQLAHEARLQAFRELCLLRGRRYVTCTLESITEPARGLKIDAFKTAIGQLKQFRDQMQDKCHTGEGGVVLIGPPGTGKDHIMFALMRHAILECGFRVAWFDGVRLLAKIKSAIADHSTESLLRQLSSVQVLCVSDPIPPRDELTAFEMSVLRDIFERRYSDKAATWVSTNVQSEQDAARLFSAPLLGRLVDGSLVVSCQWDNYRRPK